MINRKPKRKSFQQPWNREKVNLKLFVSPSIAERIWRMDDAEGRPRTLLNLSRNKPQIHS